MALFGGKKKSNQDVVAENEERNAAVDKKAAKKDKGKKKSKKNDLLKIFDESVWESVREDFKANKQFIVNDLSDDGSPRYICLMFDTESVGGFTSKDAKRDESKGSIIEAVRTGRIKTYIRPEMLMDNLFIIIPDEETIDNMSEFVMLTEADYILSYVDDKGIVNTITQNGDEDDDDDPEVMVTFDQISGIINKKGDVHTLIPYMNNNSVDSDSERFEDFGDDDVDPDGEIEDLPENLEDAPDDDFSDIADDPDELNDIPGTDMNGPLMSGSDTDLDGLDDFNDMPDAMDDMISDDVQDNNGDMGYDAANTGDNSGFGDFNPDDEGGFDEYDDVTGDVVHDYIDSQFYTDDLGLKVSTEPFDSRFLHGNAYQPFKEDRGTGWLNEYLSNIAKDANTRMERMHSENLFKMRERYMRLIQGHCLTIANQLDTSNTDTQYGRMKYAIEQNKKNNLSQLDEVVNNKKVQLEMAWEAKLNMEAEAAALNAKRQYEADHGAAHANDLAMIESREKDEIERDYRDAMTKLNDDRRSEASKLLDIAVSETLKKMSDVYLQVLNVEKREYIRLQNEMTRFIDDNRKDEKARIDALAEENRQVKKAQEVRRDFTSKIKAMSAEFDMKRTMLQADIDRINKEHEFELEQYKTEWSDKLHEEKEKTNALQHQVDSLLEKYAELDDRKKSEYESRITELEQLNRTKDDDMDRLMSAHKRSNTITILLVIAILIASIGVGFMLGTVMNVRKMSQIEQEGIYKQYSTEESVPVDPIVMED